MKIEVVLLVFHLILHRFVIFYRRRTVYTDPMQDFLAYGLGCAAGRPIKVSLCELYRLRFRLLGLIGAIKQMCHTLLLSGWALEEIIVLNCQVAACVLRL